MAAAVFYIGAGFVTEALTKHYLPAIEKSALKSGVRLSGIQFQRAGLASFKSIKWESVSARLRPVQAENREFSFTVDRFELDLAALLDQHLKFRGSNMSLSLNPAVPANAGPEPRKTKSIQGDFSCRIPLASLDSRGIVAAIRGTSQKLSALVRQGRAELDLEYRGTSYFTIKGNRFYAELYTVREGSGVRLVMNAEDVRRIAMHLDEDLTDAEILLISRNPVRAPRLFEIKEYTKREAEEASSGSRAVPQDAYKHVLWSYLLAREFGDEFSKEVTDAHEEGGRGNTEADHLMDYQNNVIGRRYALEKVPEAEVLERMMKDPAVIREASETQRVKAKKK